MEIKTSTPAQGRTANSELRTANQTVAAQMDECDQSEQSRARKQAGSPCVGGEPEESAGDMRKFNPGRSLTRLRWATAWHAVAALLRGAGASGAAAEI